MGSRKNILKNLGIPEYPWSSDDDEPPIDSTPEPRPAANPQLRPSAEQTTPSSPGTSGRELFLSLLSLPSNGNRSGTAPPGSSSHRYFRSENVPLAYLSRSPHTPAPELRERPGGRDDSHIQRVLAFKRLTRNMGMGSNSGIGRYTRCQIPRGRGSTRPGSVVPSEINGSSCMRMAHWRTVRRPYTSNRTGTAHQFMDQSGTSAAHRHRTHSMEVNNSDDEQDDPVVSRSRPTGSMSALTSTPEPPIELETEVDAHASAIDTSGVSPEEDIVEILDEPVAVDLDMVVPHFMAKGRSPAIPAIPTSTDSNLPSTSREDEVDAPQAEIQSQGVKRKRCTSSDDKASDSFTVKEFNQSLLRLLECPVCLEWMEPPMSQCRRGHLVCNRCRARLASCPVCRTTFSSVRNRAMEGVAEMLRYPCRHGCGREVRLRRRTPHEASCNSRHYMCPAPLCTHKLPLPHSLLAAHFNSKHLNLLKLGCRHRFGIKVNSESHDTWLLIALEQYFQVRVDVDVRTWGVIVYVAYIGPKCNAKDYAYEVSIEGQHNGRRLNYRRSTHSDLESSSLNVSRQDCFHLTLDQALNFIRFKNRHCDAEKFLEFDVEISKIDPPPSRDDSDS